MLTCSYIVFVYSFVLLGVDVNFETVTLSFQVNIIQICVSLKEK